MKGMTLKRWIVVALLAAAVVIAFAPSRRLSNHLFSVRVVQFTPGASNTTLIEITNHTPSRLSFTYRPPTVPTGQISISGDLRPHQARLIRFSGVDGEASVIGMVSPQANSDSQSWFSRQYERVLERLGKVRVTVVWGDLQFSLMKTTGWMHSGEMRNDGQ